MTTTTTNRAPAPAAGSPSLMHRLTVLFGPIGRPLAGTRWFPLWAILRHTGRKSGATYAIPVVVLPTNDGFVVPLPFGEGTQWLRNLFAAGSGGMRWKGREYTLDRPELVDLDDPAVADAVPGILRAISRRIGIHTWARVQRGD